MAFMSSFAKASLHDLLVLLCHAALRLLLDLLLPQLAWALLVTAVLLPSGYRWVVVVL
jgi:hypothetical protein